MKKIFALAAMALILPPAAYSLEMPLELNVGLNLAIPTNDAKVKSLTGENISWGTGLGLNVDVLTKVRENLSAGLGLDYTGYMGEEYSTTDEYGITEKEEFTHTSFALMGVVRYDLKNVIQTAENIKLYIPAGVGIAKTTIIDHATDNDYMDKLDVTLETSSIGLACYIGFGAEISSWNFEARFTSLPQVNAFGVEKTNRLNSFNILARYKFNL